MITKDIEYKAGDTNAIGYIAYEKSAMPKPLVMIVHDWTGRNPFAEEQARKLAELGYIGFAVDMYGQKKNGRNNDEKAKLMTPLIENRKELLNRMKGALNACRQLKEVNPQKIAAIGFCFGGLCVLDLARSGADIKGVVSLHGALSAPDIKSCVQIKASILAIHGYADPMVTPTVLSIFCEEMETSGCDWQVHAYGQTLHAFTNPLANDKDFGTVYDKTAAKRSAIATENFLAECFN